MSTKYLWELEEREWDDVIAVHLKGHFTCFQAAARVMIEQGRGSLVAISSGASFMSPPNLVSYSAAKAGVLGLLWSTANSLGRFGINANCVMPNAATRMSDSVYGNAEWLTDQVGETIRSDLAEGTYRDPSQMAPIIVYLLTDAAKEINGQVFGAQGYEVQHLAPIGWAEAMTNTGPWDVATLADELPGALGPNLKPPNVAWPEKRR
jgi:NAD(P)-dependent dehydrogenase (short-subunit alcohol dehydrogenase family)